MVETGIEKGVETLDIMPGPGQKEALAAKEKAQPDQCKTILSIMRGPEDTIIHKKDCGCLGCIAIRRKGFLLGSKVIHPKGLLDEKAKVVPGYMADGPDPTKTLGEASREALNARIAAAPADRCEGCNAGDCSKPPRMPSDVEDLIECCFQMREELLVMVGRLAGLIENHPAMKARSTTGRDPNNPTSHALLAFRDLEDAHMRLGKVVQMLDGGKSCYSR